MWDDLKQLILNWRLRRLDENIKKMTRARAKHRAKASKLVRKRETLSPTYDLHHELVPPTATPKIAS